MRTLEEKIEYNKKQKTNFSNGYLDGVKNYREYGKKSVFKKADAQVEVSRINMVGKWGQRSGKYSPDDVQYSKGFMCGMRDCAAERKKEK